MLLLIMATVSFANMFISIGVVSLPLSDQGPHIAHGWGQVVRLRHLYAAKPGLHLLITGEGQIQSWSINRSNDWRWLIHPVDPGCVVIRGAATARFLCIQGDGRLYSSLTYSKNNCTFREQILKDGYNIYTSVRHGTLLSLGNQRQRLQGRDRGVPALAQFLPRINTLEQPYYPGLDIHDQSGQYTAQIEELVDTMDSFGKVPQILHSPSFHER
uniref:Fibroblast growth factor n=1 Tax=Mola mola TaxID=94237 RepID=A0A3Q4BJN3_MOLML